MEYEIEFKVVVRVIKAGGKFASKEEVLGVLREEIELANPNTISGLGPDGATDYDIDSWEVDEA